MSTKGSAESYVELRGNVPKVAAIHGTIGNAETPTEELEITKNGTYNTVGYGKAIVDVQPKLQEKTATASGEVTPDVGYDGLSKVKVNIADNVKAQSKAVTPTAAKQTVLPDAGYTHLSAVTVNPIPSEYIVPSGELEITEDGTYDVTDKARVVIKVGDNSSDIPVYIANDSDHSIKYALSGVKANMTWREWIATTGGNVGSNAGWIWIEDSEDGTDTLWCGSYAEIYDSNGDVQTPDSVIVEGEPYYSYEII